MVGLAVIAGKPVGAAALHAHHQFAGGDGFAAELPGIGGQFFEDLAPGGQFVLHILADQELDPVMVVVPQFFQELFVGQVLAPQG